MPGRILVTGATGYIALHILARLLNRGETVVGSARSTKSDGKIREAILPELSDKAALEKYSTVALDLTSDDGWAEAMNGVDRVIHTASPFPLTQPKDDEELIRPAVDGTLRVLRAARDAGVSRVAMTSSSVAIMENHEKTVFDERDWSSDGPTLSPYARSKTRAERAAWDFLRDEAPGLELAVINPTFVQGAPLGETYGTSVSVIERLLEGKDPMLPRVGFPICDVGDVAEAHIRALEVPDAAGHRHIVSDRFLWFREMADVVREAVPSANPARREAPNFAMRVLALFDPAIRTIVPQLGRKFEGDNRRLREVLGIEPRDVRESIADTAHWLAARD